eukprot:4554364-Prymnesium_polylepis.1
MRGARASWTRPSAALHGRPRASFPSGPHSARAGGGPASRAPRYRRRAGRGEEQGCLWGRPTGVAQSWRDAGPRPGGC